ncbi:hypothetical protein [Tessaracoccus sp. OH4464_COT-324]|uniref:hypothetical protein n=1 Tax=Tessaracoccus sp. OH4464_COT-324 TaxID=2491059 RepID=UPI000F639D22|nr:hypothetical protein [Tessaracoccus sp. OH4464_COT-324]RRD47429.1 hypothetical protein EII42_02230 [Tessaracoccus sp. OH4464_COT-324]
MSDNRKPNVFVDHDPDELEPSLNYKKLARRAEKDRKLGRATPVVGGGVPTTAGMVPAAGMAGLGGAAVASAATTREEVHFTDDQLVAGQPSPENEDDPWGINQGLDDVPAPEDDRDKRAGVSRSGTRGSDRGETQGGMPLTSLGIGAGATAGAGGFGAATTGMGGSSMGPQIGLPVGVGQGSMGGAMGGMGVPVPGAFGGLGGPVSANTIAMLQAQKSSGAFFAPMSTGVMAAGADMRTLSSSELNQRFEEEGINVTDEYILGPDGRMHANPYYRPPSMYAMGGESVRPGMEIGGPGNQGPGGGITVAPPPPQPRRSDHDRVGDSDSGSRGSEVGGSGSQWGAPLPPSSPGAAGSGGAVAPARPAAPGAGASYSGRFNSAPGRSAAANDRGGSSPDRFRGSTSDAAERAARDAAAKAAEINARYGVTRFEQVVAGGAAAAAAAGALAAAAAGAAAVSGGDYSGYTVNTSELRSEADGWRSIGEEHGALAGSYSNMPDPGSMFSVLTGLIAPYTTAAREIMSGVAARGDFASDVALRLRASAAAYDRQEDLGASISEGVGK